MIVTRQQMIECEMNSHLSEAELMEMAGRQCAYALMDEIRKENQVLILCGKGNNGGDGFVMARFLLQHNVPVKVYLAEKEVKSNTACSMMQQLDSDIFIDEDIMNVIDTSDVIVDCVYGFSFRGQLNEEIAGLFDAVNQSEARVFSVDINSGMEADTGNYDPHAILSEVTFALGHYKICHLFQKDHQCFQKLKLIEMDLPSPKESSLMELNENSFKKKLPVKAIDSYKNVNGRTLCITGCRKMPGAAILSGISAWKTGIGYLHLASEETVKMQMVQKFPVAVTHDLEEIDTLSDKLDSVVIGCGCDGLPDFENILFRLLEDSTLPCVVDAYGLRVLSDHLHLLDGARAEVILTPHLGEFAALSKISAKEILKDKVNIAKHFAQEHGVTLVLKGPNTLVVSSDGRMYVNQTGHQNLAKAGSGDVLAGLIGGFCAQQLDPFTACCMAVWLHGQAADCSDVPDPSFSAMDLLDSIDFVYRQLL